LVTNTGDKNTGGNLAVMSAQSVVDVFCYQHRDVTANIVVKFILQFEKDNALQTRFPSALIFNAANKNLAT